MQSQDPAKVFDEKHAADYDRRFARVAPMRDALHLLVGALFSELPADARLLCVGAGTGSEILYLAEKRPGWRFVAVEPSSGMVNAARQRAEQHGYAERCRFHTGYLETLPDDAPFDGATALLVSQFLLDTEERVRFFRDIAGRLRPGGLLASSDLAADTAATSYPDLLALWLRTLAAADLSPERLQQMRAAYDRDVAILPPEQVAALIAAAGFTPPVRLYQAGLITAWYTQRSTGQP